MADRLIRNVSTAERHNSRYGMITDGHKHIIPQPKTGRDGAYGSVLLVTRIIC